MKSGKEFRSMKRYCRIKKEYLNTEKAKLQLSWTLDYKTVIQKVSEQYAERSKSPQEKTIELANNLYGMNSQPQLFGEDDKFENNTKLRINNLDNIMSSKECELDFLCDIYLVLKNLLGEEEQLFSEQWKAEQWKVEQFDEQSGKSSIEVAKKTISNIKSRYKQKKVDSYPEIFDLSILQSTAKDTSIPSLGSGIVRMYLVSKAFRNLFKKVETDQTKYSTDNIISVIEEVERVGIKFKRSDFIILEKILSLNARKAFEDSIYPECKLENQAEVKKIFDIIMYSTIIHTRCVLCKCIGDDLISLKRKYRNGNHEINWMEKYIKTVEMREKQLEDRYEQMLTTALDEIIDVFRIENGLDYVERSIEYLASSMVLNNKSKIPQNIGDEKDKNRKYYKACCYRELLDFFNNYDDKVDEKEKEKRMIKLFESIYESMMALIRQNERIKEELDREKGRIYFLNEIESQSSFINATTNHEEVQAWYGKFISENYKRYIS